MKILLFRDIVNYDKEAEINERGEEKEKNENGGVHVWVFCKQGCRCQIVMVAHKHNHWIRTVNLVSTSSSTWKHCWTTY